MIDTIKISVENFQIKNKNLFIVDKCYSIDRKINDKESKIERIYIKNGEIETFEEVNKKMVDSWNTQNPFHIHLMKAYLNLTKDGIYMPKINYSFSPFNELLYIEFSIPKLLFGNNLYEVSETDFERVIDTLSNALGSLGIEVSITDLKNALVRKVHYSKNFILDLILNCIDVLNFFKATKYPSITNFKDYIKDKCIQASCDTFAISMYDKIREIRDKKSVVNIDENIINEYLNRIFRIEFKFEGTGVNKKLANSILGYPDGTKLKFKDVYKKEIFEKVFVDGLTKLQKNMPTIIFEPNKIEELERVSLDFKELAERLLLITYKEKYGNYEEAINKIREISPVSDEHLRKRITYLTDKEKLVTIFNDFLQEVENYTPIQEKLNNK